ncbi:acyltransferase [Leptospira bourretii]|uniref:Acyltransferase n=1 Tax=Leptospira bourretii TaxID=2484962 RepID=A0A4R9IR95_9LEPT|nr:acyltransferase [Leptospira bourretii]TGK85624.1 acyltransferase [Leptospira bourretii]TGK94521.1 acyltransferase [Leptospira bourretii]TGL24877.1 acyltransferase [Leptospira bourretii]TGL37110.1 acyltransferase [Leptospira bourretii]
MKKYFHHLTNPHPREILSLHTIRGIGIIVVLMVHFTHTIAKDAIIVNPQLFLFFSNFSSALDAFFVLSGFLISEQLFRAHKNGKDMSFKRFFRNRVLRIFPGYYFFISTIALLTFLQILLIENAIEKKGITDLNILSAYIDLKSMFRASWADFVFVGNYIKNLHVHTWSLSVEEQFYFCIPFFMTFVLFKYPKHTMTFLGSLYVIALLFRLFYFYSDDVTNKFEKMYYSTETRYDAFIVGIIIAYWSQYKPEILKSKFLKSSITFSIFILLIVLSHLIRKDDSFMAVTFKNNLINLGFGSLVIACLNMNDFSYNTPIRSIYKSTMTFLARISFTIYLWHMTVLSVLGNLKLTKPDYLENSVFYLIYFIGYALLSISVGVVLYRLIEYPFIMIKDKHKTS